VRGDPSECIHLTRASAFGRRRQAEITSETNSSSFTPRIIADVLSDPPAVSQLVAFDGLDALGHRSVSDRLFSPRHGPGQYHSSLSVG
jgi:hypothetical protein